MLKSLMGLLGMGGPEYDARILARDSRSMIDMVHGQHGAASLQIIASTCREHIELVHERGINDPQFYEQGIVHLTELNKAARMRRDNVVWSGITLSIIYVKAEILVILDCQPRTFLRASCKSGSTTAILVMKMKVPRSTKTRGQIFFRH